MKRIAQRINTTETVSSYNIFLMGNIVISDECIVMVKSIAHNLDDCFTGTVIVNRDDTYAVGHYSDMWLKKLFKQFTGKIEIDMEEESASEEEIDDDEYYTFPERKDKCEDKLAVVDNPNVETESTVEDDVECGPISLDDIDHKK